MPLANDEDGLVPDALEAACVALAREGKLSHPKSPLCHVPILPTSHRIRMCRFLRAGVHPKLLYIVPVGQNPTGSRLSAYALFLFCFILCLPPFFCFWPRVGTLPLSQRALTSNRRPNPQTPPQEFEPRAPPPIFGSTRGRYEHIYRICTRHGLVIVEDDAYYYMQHRADAASRALPGLRGLGPSFLSIDSDGRVLRLDSFSKLLAPGFR